MSSGSSRFPNNASSNWRRPIPPSQRSKSTSSPAASEPPSWRPFPATGCTRTCGASAFPVPSAVSVEIASTCNGNAGWTPLRSSPASSKAPRRDSRPPPRSLLRICSLPLLRAPCAAPKIELESHGPTLHGPYAPHPVNAVGLFELAALFIHCADVWPVNPLAQEIELPVEIIMAEPPPFGVSAQTAEMIIHQRPAIYRHSRAILREHVRVHVPRRQVCTRVPDGLDPTVSLRPAIEIPLVHEAPVRFRAFLAPRQAIVAPVRQAPPPGIVISPVNPPRVVQTILLQVLQSRREAVRRKPYRRAAQFFQHRRGVAKKPGVCIDVDHRPRPRPAL